MKCLKYVIYFAPFMGAAALEVNNSCADKQFCQRIVLVVNGAGKDKVEAGTPDLDRFASSALDDAKLLSSQGANQNPPLTYIFSGNQELDTALKEAKIPNAKLFNSNQSDWNSFVESLPKELEPLLENPRCKEVVKGQITSNMSLKEKLAVLSKYISVEVSLYGHSIENQGNHEQRYGISFGGINKIPTADDDILFTSKDFLAFKDILKNATVRGITQACNGVEVIKTIAPTSDAECSCFVSASDSSTMAMSWDNRSPFGLLDLNSKRKSEKYAGLDSLLQITDSLYEPYVASRSSKNVNNIVPAAPAVNSGALRNRQYGDEEYPDSIYALYDTVEYQSLPHNPLSGLVKSSADIAAQNALKFIASDKSSDADVANGLLTASYTSQLVMLAKNTKDQQLAGFVNQALENAKLKADRMISQSSRVTLDQGKEYINYGIREMELLFNPSTKTNPLSSSQRAFVDSIKSAEAYFTDKSNSLAIDQFQKFHEMLNPKSENYWGHILMNPGETSDLKLRMIWGRWDYIRSALSGFYRAQYQAAKLTSAQYDGLITELEKAGTSITSGISGYIGARASVLKKEAFIANDVRSSVALKMLERRVKQPKADQQATAVDQIRLYSKLLSQIDCLQSYGYGPNTFTPEGKTRSRTHAEMGVR